MEIISAEYY